MNTLQLFLANEGYLAALCASIHGAKRRILLETMDLDTVRAMRQVLEACSQASQRGVAVTVVYDIHSYSNALREHGRAGLRQLRQWEVDVAQSTMTVYAVGARGLNPFAGRHHAKVALIDDHAYIGGGVNLTASSFTSHDFMLRYNDTALADALYAQLPTIALERARDATLYSTDTTEVLVDAGNRGDSLIYDRICDMASRAVQVWYVSKLAPDGRLVQILRQKKTQYWYNSISSAQSFDKVAVLIDQIKVRVPNSYSGKAMLHAKFCVFRLPDGQYQAMTGSHNFNSRGVAFGTQELAVHTKDQALCRQLVAYAEELSKSR